ncbi:MAG: helix-turn-helix domain-containing protein [Nitrospirae bacterium]|nr:helix-turn-helix domain-containing protein [Nitrospirota bacterium]
MICPVCGKKTVRKRDLYHYSESGLENVFLETDIYKCKCGEIIPDIPNIHGLHELVAKDLVRRESPLNGKELKFLRKQMRLKASELAQLLSVHKVTLSRWENGSEKISMGYDKLIRFLYTQMLQEKCNTILKIIDGIRHIRPGAKRIKIVIPKKEIKDAVCHL